MRFVKLNLYFFVMYSLLTAIWYGLTGRFDVNRNLVIREIIITSAVFSLAFTGMVLIWYWRTTIRIPAKSISKKNLEQRIEEAGFAKINSEGKQVVLVFKPVPPKASAMAGKIFIEQHNGFYQVHGPKKFLKFIGEV